MPRRNRNAGVTLMDPMRARVEPREQMWRYRHAREWAAKFTNMSSEDAHDYASWFVDAYGHLIDLHTSHRSAHILWEDAYRTPKGGLY